METELDINTEKLRLLRNQKGWTQQQLADVCGLSLRTIQRTEKSGSASQETISSLSSVFEVNRDSWSMSDNNTFRVNHRAWRIAFISILVFQAFAALVVYLYIGEISSFWLKLLFATDGFMVIFYGVLALTDKNTVKPVV